jgi:hypothetical protein
MFQCRKGRTYRRSYLKLDIAMPTARGYQPRMLCLRHPGPDYHRQPWLHGSINQITPALLRSFTSPRPVFSHGGGSYTQLTVRPSARAAVVAVGVDAEGCGVGGWPAYSDSTSRGDVTYHVTMTSCGVRPPQSYPGTAKLPDGFECPCLDVYNPFTQRK